MEIITSFVSQNIHLLHDVFELQNGHAHQSIIPGKAVVLDADVQLEVVQLLLVADHAAI